MFRVELPCPTARELPEQMSAMREWLDHNRVEPMFHYPSGNGEKICRVDFPDEANAAAFAARFGGTVLGARPDHEQIAG